MRALFSLAAHEMGRIKPLMLEHQRPVPEGTERIVIGMNRRQYSTQTKERARFAAALAVILILCAGLWIGAKQTGKTEWDAEYPMPNAHISWEQTWYSGAWGN